MPVAPDCTSCAFLDAGKRISVQPCVQDVSRETPCAGCALAAVFRVKHRSKPKEHRVEAARRKGGRVISENAKEAWEGRARGRGLTCGKRRVTCVRASGHAVI